MCQYVQHWWETKGHVTPVIFPVEIQFMTPTQKQQCMSGQRSQSNDRSDWRADVQWTVLTVFCTRLTSLQFLILTSSIYSVEKNVQVKALWVLKSKTGGMVYRVAAPCSKCLIWDYVSQVPGENRQRNRARRKPVYKAKVAHKPWTLPLAWIGPLWP